MTRRLNPILIKEMKIGARTIRYPVLIMLYNLLLAFVGVLIIFQVNVLNEQMQVGYQIMIFPVMGWIQFAMICILMPVLTANSIAGERERQTLDMMLTTTMTTRQVVRGKIISSVGIVMVFLFSGMPVVSLAFLYGGLKWYYLILLMGVLLVDCILFSTIGVYCSACMKRTVSSVILGYLIEIIGMVGGYMLWRSLKNWSWEMTDGLNKVEESIEMLALTCNPVTVFQQFLESAYSGIGYERNYLWRENTACVDYLKYGMVWMGLILFLFISYILYRRAAYHLNPLRKSRRTAK